MLTKASINALLAASTLASFVLLGCQKNAQDTADTEQWSVQTTDKERPYSITGAPHVINGKVIIGNGGAELGVRVYVSAYAADSGEMAWRGV